MRTVFENESGHPDDWDISVAAITAASDGSADVGFIERAIASLLRVVREQLQLEVVFVGEFVNKNRIFRHISARTEPAIIRRGQFHPLDETICLRIVDGRLPSLVPDVTRVKPVAGLPNYYEGMGAHIGVPVRFSDGRLYGVLCGFSFEARSHLDERDVRRLEMAANATARLLAQAEGHDLPDSASA